MPPAVVQPPEIRPTVIVRDTAPLIHLAAGGVLHVLTGMGRVVVPDVIELEATGDLAKPFAREIADWLERGRQPGTNQPVEVAESEFGPLYRLAMQQGVTR